MNMKLSGSSVTSRWTYRSYAKRQSPTPTCILIRSVSQGCLHDISLNLNLKNFKQVSVVDAVRVRYPPAQSTHCIMDNTQSSSHIVGEDGSYRYMAPAPGVVPIQMLAELHPDPRDLI
ncbi:hypothetical protein FRC02_012439 [Tulasnella sp. 418]|nr:hypothetical protein FRC02_012439 [Tulasnella sp. 418]